MSDKILAPSLRRVFVALLEYKQYVKKSHTITCYLSNVMMYSNHKLCTKVMCKAIFE